MRFCPFCAQENPDEERECVHCGKRLPAMRSAPARPSSSLTNKAVPRPPVPRPAPRARPGDAPARPATIDAPARDPSLVDAHAHTALPATLPPPPVVPLPPLPPGKAGPADRTLEPAPPRHHNEATLKPLASIKPKPESDAARGHA